MWNTNRFSVLIIVSFLTFLFVIDVDTTEPIIDGSNSALSFKDSLESGGEGPEMVIVRGGTFQMGCLKDDDCRDEELPVRDVSVAKFALGKYEVTFAEYDKFAKQPNADYQTTLDGVETINQLSTYLGMTQRHMSIGCRKKLVNSTDC